LGRHNNQRSDGVSGGKVVGEETWTGGTRGGRHLLVVLSDKMSDEKNENREGDEAMSFNGFSWMGGRNNQPKVGRNDGIHLEETASRAMTIGGDAVESFRPSDFGGKNKYNEIRRGFRRPPIDDCMQAMGGGFERTHDRWVTQEGLYSIVLGEVELGGGRE
jgi:hypothetical protein